MPSQAYQKDPLDILGHLPPDEERSPALSGDVVEFLVEVGVALHAYGEPAHTLEEALQRIAQRLGLHASFFVTPTAFHASFGSYADQQTRMVRVEAQRIDLARLRYINEIAADVGDGRMTVRAGADRIREVVARRPVRAGRWWVILLPMLQAGALTPILGGTWREGVVATGLAVIVGVLLRIFGRTPRAALLVAFVSSLLASFCAFGLRASGVDISPSLVTICAVVALMPGLSFTTAVLELSTRNLTAGTARMMGALLVLLQLAAGLVFGVLMARAVFGDVAPVAEYPAPALWVVAVGALLFAVSLFLDFRADRGDVGWIIGGGLLTFATYYWVRSLVGVEPGVFVGALMAGLVSEVYVRTTGRPVSVVLVPSITFLVPGTMGFRSVSSLVLDDIQGGIELAFMMSITGVSLAAGVLAASAIFEAWRLVVPRSGG